MLYFTKDNNSNNDKDDIIYFELVVEHKNKTKEQLDKIKEDLKKIKENKTAIIVKIIKLDNSVVGLVSHLHSLVDYVIGYGGLNKINRYFIESTSINYILDPYNESYQNKRDFIHHFNTGLNQVLMKMLKEKNIDLLFSSNILLKRDIKSLKEIGRMQASISLAHKFGVGYDFVSFEEKIDPKIELLFSQ